MRKPIIASIVLTAVALSALFAFREMKNWESKFLQVNKDGSLQYIPDAEGVVLLDFSRFGYYAGAPPSPDVPVVKAVGRQAENQDEALIQSAIDKVSKRTPIGRTHV